MSEKFEHTYSEHGFKKKPTYIFDGFCHRPYKEETDGWMMVMKDETPAVELAHEIIDQHKEINRLRRRIWELEQKHERDY